MAKPRTNWDAAAHWADSILEREPRPRMEVNSIIIERDTIYSFGRHYPMGVIMRDERGRARRVVINADYYPSRGFADTPGDQSNVKTCAHAVVTEHNTRGRGPTIELSSQYLSAYSLKGRIQIRPHADDPKPDWPRMEIPTAFFARDPGPEPVKDPNGCLAGEREEYEYQDENYVTSNLDLYADDQNYVYAGFDRTIRAGAFLTRKSRGAIYSRVMHRGVIEWGEKSSGWMHYSDGRTPAGVTYKQCPHCAVFDAIHERWYVGMHGERWGRGSGRGYELYAEMIERFGSIEEWRIARREDWRRVRRGRVAFEAWESRNFISFDAVKWSRDKWGTLTPDLDDDGFPLRRDERAYFKAQREQERRRRRACAERLRREREQRQVERFKASVRRRRRPTFEQRAAEVARTLAEIAEGLKVTIETSNDSQEITT